MPEIESLEINNEIDKTVDSMINILKRQLVSPEGFEKRGLWDRFKNLTSNIWYGRYGQKNPYYFMNTLGDFAGSKSNTKKESFCPSVFTLDEYSTLKKAFDELECKINTINEAGVGENLKIMNILDVWAKQLKITLKSMIAKYEGTKKYKDNKEKNKASCEIELERKHKEGKINNTDYQKIKAMINNNEIDNACDYLTKTLMSATNTSDKVLDSTPDSTPDPTPDPTPDSADKGSDSADKGSDSADKGSDLADKGSDLADKGSDLADKGSDAEDPDSSPDVWPFNTGESKDDFLKTDIKIGSKTEPTEENSYLTNFENYRDKGLSDKDSDEYKHYFELVNLRKKMREMVKDKNKNTWNEDEWKDDFKKLKRLIYHIVVPKKEDEKSGHIRNKNENIHMNKRMTINEKINHYKNLLKQRN